MSDFINEFLRVVNTPKIIQTSMFFNSRTVVFELVFDTFKGKCDLYRNSFVSTVTSTSYKSKFVWIKCIMSLCIGTLKGMMSRRKVHITCNLIH